MDEKYKIPRKDTCEKCWWFIDHCTLYPKEKWPEIWLSNQCGGYISRPKRERTIKYLERRAAEIESVPTILGVPATALDKEHLVMLCQLFADEWQKAQAKYYEALDNAFPSYIAGGCATANLILKLRKAHEKMNWRKPLPQPTLWRRIWTRIKKAFSTPDSAQDGTKTSAKA